LFECEKRREEREEREEKEEREEEKKERGRYSHCEKKEWIMNEKVGFVNVSK
jgi:hypothetical protein